MGWLDEEVLNGARTSTKPRWYEYDSERRANAGPDVFLLRTVSLVV